MVGWHHRLNGHEIEQTLVDSEGQGSLTCCSPMGSQRIGHDLTIEQQWFVECVKKEFKKLHYWHKIS